MSRAVFIWETGDINFAELSPADISKLEVTIQYIHHGRVHEIICNGLGIKKHRTRTIQSEDDLNGPQAIFAHRDYQAEIADLEAISRHGPGAKKSAVS